MLSRTKFISLKIYHTAIHQTSDHYSQQASTMLDPVSITCAVGACNFAVGAIEKLVPLIHDGNTRKRLTRLDILLQKVEDGTLSTEEHIEAKKLKSKINRHAVMTQNAVLIAYLEKGTLLLGAHKSETAEVQINLIMLDDDCEARPSTEEVTAPFSPRPSSSIEPVAFLPEVASFISFGEHLREFDTKSSITDHTAPSETTLPIYSSRSSATYSTVQEEKPREDPIIEAIANAKRPKAHANLKKAACWSLLLTTGPVALLAPQVRRNL